MRIGWSCLVIPLALVAIAPLHAQRAKISEATQMIATYPFSEPNRIPILTRDTRLYPYHSFEGYSHTSSPKAWKVVHLENDLIDVYVLPEVGGKVWGAVVKRSGHEFIYRNEVLKFRNIALRGPWTSGGIEFNFGVIGHTPSTATPVDYVTRENADGSVSCIVGMMDLPSRTHWRVEIRVPADRATFETNVLWYNPTTLEQPYYNWMTAAAPARNDLLMTIPGNTTLEHSGLAHEWPIDAAGRFLPQYSANTFGGHKSNHIVGERTDFFGGYLADAGYGFGHWAAPDDMPGRKLWLWALSREGGIWEDLLTDTDGQYVEYQAGRLLVQYSPGADVNPIQQAGFDPGASDSWSDTWFPLEGTGGLTEASRNGAIYARAEGDHYAITVTAFGNVTDTLRVWQGGTRRLSVPLTLEPLVPVTYTLPGADSTNYRIQLDRLGIDYRTNRDSVSLARPWVADSAATLVIPEATRLATSARQLALGRRYPEARALYQRVLQLEPWNRDALLGMGELELRRGEYSVGLVLARRLLQLNTYDPDANFLAGNLYRELGQRADALDSYGWAARSTRYRAVANVQLAELHLAGGDQNEAERYARRALNYDRVNLPAREVLAMVARQRGDAAGAARLRTEMLEIDPLHHFVFAEGFLDRPDSASGARFTGMLRGEYPDQVILELAIDYVRRGARDDALHVLAFGHGAEINAWRAFLADDPGQLNPAADLAFAFPFRRESIPVLEWAIAHSVHWSWRYLLALNLWGCDRPEDAAAILASLDQMDFAPALVTRALLLQAVRGQDPESDLRLAVARDPADRTIAITLVQYLQRSARWADALAASTAARAKFAGDFNLALLHAGSLLQLGRPVEAIAILDRTNVLPSEHARESHHLYQQARTLAALDGLDRGQVKVAERHLRAALEWPEHLGQGRPYQPEERLQHYLLGVIASRRGNAASARAEWRAVLEVSSAGPSLVTELARARLGLGSMPVVPVKIDATFDDRLVARAMGVRP